MATINQPKKEVEKVEKVKTEGMLLQRLKTMNYKNQCKNNNTLKKSRISHKI